MVIIDLYNSYINRFAGYNILPAFPDNQGWDLKSQRAVPSKKQVFYGLLRIILGCDAAHDFMAARGRDLDDDEKKLFREGTSAAVTLDLTRVMPGLDSLCESLINYSSHRISGDNTYFNSDTIAKETVNKILNYLGLNLVPLNEIGYGDCTGDYGITRMVKIIKFANTRETTIPGIDFILRVDATQNPTDMIPIYSSLLKEARLRNSNCPNTHNIKLGEDISSVYDAANDDKLQKALKENNFLLSTINNTTFDVKCDIYDVVKCSLNLVPGTSTVVSLNVLKYFTQDINVSVTNEKVGSVANNSVKGLVNKMKTESSLAGVNKMEIIYKYSIAKTLGDFLQIISYLNVPTNQKIFISADILSTKICSLFSKASFIENIGTKENLITGMGVYMTKDEADRQSAASQLLIMASQRKRGRNQFGKKSNKLNTMSNEELKTKIKSVGINVTKISSKGKRLPLTRKEMEKKAMMFKNLQLRAKKIGIKVMYKSKRRGYVYKTYTRLMNELEKLKRGKMKFG